MEKYIWISTINDDLYKKHYGDAIRSWHNLPGRKILFFDGKFPTDIPFIELIDYWSVIDKNNNWFTKKQSKKIVRLSYKAWIIHWALKNLNCERLIFIDADITANKDLPENLISNHDNLWSTLCFNYSANHDWAEYGHQVESGLQIFNKTHKDIDKFADKYISYYTTGEVYNLPRAYDNWISADMLKYFPVDNLVIDPTIKRNISEDTMKHTRFANYLTHYLGKGNKVNIPRMTDE